MCLKQMLPNPTKGKDTLQNLSIITSYKMVLKNFIINE